MFKLLHRCNCRVGFKRGFSAGAYLSESDPDWYVMDMFAEIHNWSRMCSNSVRKTAQLQK